MASLVEEVHHQAPEPCTLVLELADTPDLVDAEAAVAPLLLTAPPVPGATGSLPHGTSAAEPGRPIQQRFVAEPAHDRPWVVHS